MRESGGESPIKSIEWHYQQINRSRVAPREYLRTFSGEEQQQFLKELYKTRSFVTIHKDNDGVFSTGVGTLQAFNISGRRLPNEGEQIVVFKDVYDSDGESQNLRLTFHSSGLYNCTRIIGDEIVAEPFIVEVRLEGEDLYLVRNVDFDYELEMHYSNWLERNMQPIDRYHRLVSPRARAQFLAENFDSLISYGPVELGIVRIDSDYRDPFQLHHVAGVIDAPQRVVRVLEDTRRVAGDDLFVDLMLMRNRGNQSLIDIIYSKDRESIFELMRAVTDNGRLTPRLYRLPGRLSIANELDAHTSSVNSSAAVSALKLLRRYADAKGLGHGFYEIESPIKCSIIESVMFSYKIEEDILWLMAEVENLLTKDDDELINFGTVPLSPREHEKLLTNLYFSHILLQNITQRGTLSSPYSVHQVPNYVVHASGLRVVDFLGFLSHSLRTGEGVDFAEGVDRKRFLNNHMIRVFEGMRNILREYNHSDSLNEEDNGKCPDGIVNELLNVLSGFHRDVKIVSVNHSDFTKDIEDQVNSILGVMLRNPAEQDLAYKIIKDILFLGAIGAETSEFLLPRIEAMFKSRYDCEYLYPAEDFYRSPRLFRLAIANLKIEPELLLMFKEIAAPRITERDIAGILQVNSQVNRRVLLRDGDSHLPITRFFSNLNERAYREFLSGLASMNDVFIEPILPLLSFGPLEEEALLSYLESTSNPLYKQRIQRIVERCTYLVVSSLVKRHPTINKDVFNRYLEVGNIWAAAEILHTLGEDINQVDAFGHTPLTLCIEKNNVEMFRRVIAMPEIDINMLNHLGGVPIIMAIDRGPEFFRPLLLRPELNLYVFEPQYKIHLLFQAIAKDSEELIGFILDRAPNLVNEPLRNKKYPFQYAVEKNSQVAIKAMLQVRDVNPNVKYKGKTPLIEAILGNKIEVARLLIECDRVDINVLDDEGKSAIYHAIDTDNKELFELLRVRPDVVYDASLLEVIKEDDRKEILYSLVDDLRFDVNMTDAEGEGSLLFHCFKENDEVLLRKLLNRVDLKVNLLEGKTSALGEYISDSSVPDSMIRMLLSRPEIDINLGSHSRTPLEIALYMGMKSRVEMILSMPGVVVTKHFLVENTVCLGDPELLRKLLECPIEKLEESVLWALGAAIRLRNPEINTMLLNYDFVDPAGVDVMLRETKEKKVWLLEEAAHHKNLTALKILTERALAKGVDIDQEALNIALKLSVNFASEDVISKLIQLGAEVNIKSFKFKGRIIDVLLEREMFEAAALAYERGGKISPAVRDSSLGVRFLKRYHERHHAPEGSFKESAGDFGGGAASGGGALAGSASGEESDSIARFINSIEDEASLLRVLESGTHRVTLIDLHRAQIIGFSQEVLDALHDAIEKQKSSSAKSFRG